MDSSPQTDWMLPIGSRVLFSYVSSTWTERRYRELGGFVAVVLNYNKHGMIGAATQSALDQDFPCYDIVCLDDHSTDGSEKEMIETLEQFVAMEKAKANPKAVRIICVVNSVNQMTTNQWKIAAKMSDGTWFGMFCGDDVSYPHRMKTAARHIAEHPTLLGLCTNADRSNGGKMLDRTGTLIWKGTDANEPLEYLTGCTAFWKRDVLVMEKGRSVIDDLILTWCAIISGAGKHDEFLLWSMDESTVAYSVGTGVTTLHELDKNRGGWWARTLRMAKIEGPDPKFAGTNLWRLVSEVDARYGSDNRVRERIRGNIRWWEIHDSGWLGRSRAAWVVLVREHGVDYGGKRAGILKYWIGRTARYSLGLASYCICQFIADVATLGRRGNPFRYEK